MNITIYGANGFIGKNLVKRFDKFDHVINAFDIKKPDLRNVGLEKTDRFDGGFGGGYKRVGVGSIDLTKYAGSPFSRDTEVIIQAAATTSGAKDIVNRPYYHVTDNAIMNTNILQSVYDLASCQPDKTFHYVFFSCTVMYPQDLNRAVTEDDFTGKIADQYFGVGWTKVYIEKLMEFYSRLLPNVKFTAIRHSNIYGPHDKFDLEKSHVFGATLNKVLTTPDGGEIEVWGDGKTIRDLLYVDDLMDFVVKAIEYQDSNFEIFNVGSGKPVSVTELVIATKSVAKKDLKIVYNRDKPSFNNGLWLDCSKAKKILEWEPKVILKEGIEKTINWLHNKAVNG